jgi:hypothetical protein
LFLAAEPRQGEPCIFGEVFGGDASRAACPHRENESGNALQAVLHER